MIAELLHLMPMPMHVFVQGLAAITVFAGLRILLPNDTAVDIKRTKAHKLSLTDGGTLANN
jgi:hypothetical protein